jgi:hypothetical protein
MPFPPAPGVAGPLGTTTLPMHPQAALLEHLQELRRVAELRDGACAVAKAGWLAAVDALFARLQAWLEPASSRGLARVERVSVHIADDEVGAYDAPALKVTMPGPRLVWVRPVGTLVVGARGYVEMVCGANRGLLVLNRDGIWKLRAQPWTRCSTRLAPLDEDEFARTLTQLIL